PESDKMRPWAALGAARTAPQRACRRRSSYGRRAIAKWASGACDALAPAAERRLPMQGKRMQGESAKQVAIDVLRAAGEPLHTKEVAKRVLDTGRCSRLKGKTPEATVAAILAVGSKPGGPFKRVEKGTYTLREPTPKAEGEETS